MRREAIATPWLTQRDVVSNFGTSAQARLRRVEKSGKPIPSVTIFAPATGFITARNAFPGQKIAPDTELYALADLSRVWVMADVFESDAHRSACGTTLRPSRPRMTRPSGSRRG